MAKKVVQDHDDELVGQYIRAIENPDSVGWNPAARRWEAPKLRGYDSRNRGMGVDVINNDAAKQLTDGRKGRYLTEAEERELRNGHIDYSQTIVNKWTPRSVLISPPSEAKRAMAAGMAYRGDNIYWNIVKNPAMSAVYYGGSDADFQKAVSEFYKSKGVFERAKNHDAFFGTDDSEEGQALSEFVRGLIDNGDRWEPPVNRHDDGGSMNKGWNNLTMSQRSEMMRWFLSKGVNSLDEMRRMYNEEAGKAQNSVLSHSTNGMDYKESYKAAGKGNVYGDGGNIYIKPENRGKFTALKERTGHSATWFKENGTPAQKKMATFALNARHWKHGNGGYLFDGLTESTQQMMPWQGDWMTDEEAQRVEDERHPYGHSLAEIAVTAPYASDSQRMKADLQENVARAAQKNAKDAYHLQRNMNQAQDAFARNFGLNLYGLLGGSPLANAAMIAAAEAAPEVGGAVAGEKGRMIGSSVAALAPVVPLAARGTISGVVKTRQGLRNVEKRGIETFMRTSANYDPLPIVKRGIQEMKSGNQGGKYRLFDIGNYVLTGHKKGPKGYYNSFAPFLPSSNSTFLNPKGKSYAFSGFLPYNFESKKPLPMTERADMIDAYLYGKEIDPSFGLSKVAKGDDFGVHQNYVNTKYPDKYHNIPIYEVKNTYSLPSESVTESGLWQGSNDGMFISPSSQRPEGLNVGGHLYTTGTSDVLGFPVKVRKSQDIWKFAPDEYTARWLKDIRENIEERPAYTPLRQWILGQGLQEIDKLGTPIITRTLWEIVK